MRKLLTLCAAVLLATSLWAGAATSSDGKFATGTITFDTIGTLSATTTYWINGVKFYSGNSAAINANTSAWSEKTNIPAYIDNATASNSADKGKWGSNGSGKQYTMSGFACSQHTVAIHVNQACTVTVVVNKNRQSDTDDAAITASLDATAYGTAWTSSNYKTAGTALTVTSARADKTNAPGRYTLTIVIAESDLTDGEAVVKMFNGSSGSGADKLFCYESITVTPSAKTYFLAFNENGHGTAPDTIKNLAKDSVIPSAPTAPTELGWNFDGWYIDQACNTAWNWGTSAITQDTTLYAKWTEDQSVTKYEVTYVLNGPTGDAPTQADAAEGAVITLAAEQTWAGHQFVGWLCDIDSEVKEAGASYTMTAANTTFTAQWCTEITPALSYNHTTVYPSFGVDILPTVTGNTGSGTVTYESSNTSVATVDENTGAVTPVAAGTATITATIAANGGYCENTAEATIKVVAAPTHLVEQRLANGNSVAWDASVIVATDNTNISGLTALSNHGAAEVDGTGKDGMTSKIKTVAAENNDNYVELSFTIAEGKKMDVSAVGVKVQSVTSDTNNFKVVLSDNKGSSDIIGTKTNATNGKLVDVDFASYGTLKGTVTLRVYAWGWTAGYRFGTGITIDGTITDIPTALDNTSDELKAIKRIENGMLIIEKNGKLYNAMGQEIR